MENTTPYKVIGDLTFWFYGGNTWIMIFISTSSYQLKKDSWFIFLIQKHFLNGEYSVLKISTCHILIWELDASFFLYFNEENQSSHQVRKYFVIPMVSFFSSITSINFVRETGSPSINDYLPWNTSSEILVYLI